MNHDNSEIANVQSAKLEFKPPITMPKYELQSRAEDISSSLHIVSLAPVSQRMCLQIQIPFVAANGDNWLDGTPDSKASVERGIEDIKAGRIRTRRSYAHLTTEVLVD